MADDYSQRVQKVCRTLCKQRGLSNDSVSEMRALLFNPTSEHDEVGTEILLEAVVATMRKSQKQHCDFAADLFGVVFLQF